MPSEAAVQHIPCDADALQSFLRRIGFIFTGDVWCALTPIFFFQLERCFPPVPIKNQTAQSAPFSVTRQLDATKQCLLLELPTDKDLYDRNNSIWIKISAQYNPRVFWELLGFWQNPTGCQSTPSSFNYGFRYFFLFLSHRVLKLRYANTGHCQILQWETALHLLEYSIFCLLA